MSYPITIWYDPKKRVWRAWFEDFGRGNFELGKTMRASIRKARKMRVALIASLIGRGIPIPEPLAFDWKYGWVIKRLKARVKKTWIVNSGGDVRERQVLEDIIQRLELLRDRVSE